MFFLMFQKMKYIVSDFYYRNFMFAFYISGFKGQNCSEDIDECNANPCINNGKCFNSFGSYQCDCDTLRFLGKNCHILNPCSPEKNPCMNGGNCTYNIVGNNALRNCSCPDGWQGPICTLKVRFLCQKYLSVINR